MTTKLIIQIPCFNEEASLAITLSALPKYIPQIDIIETCIIDDGSNDRTVEVAKECGVNHIVRVPHNRGLANAYMQGIDFCLKAGADIIVNTDADNQYRADDIHKLVEPILGNKADIVIGTRPISQIDRFSYLKKKLQWLGSWVVRYVSQTDVEDAPSGFRAITRETALRLYVFNKFTYTLETIIQAGQMGIKVLCVPIRINGDLRPSRLAKSSGDYVYRSVGTILKIFIIYRPVKTFIILGLVPFILGLILSLRWVLLFYLEDPGRSHIPSLILAAILIIVGFQTFLFAFVAELVASNRKILEENRVRLRKIELINLTGFNKD